MIATIPARPALLDDLPDIAALALQLLGWLWRLVHRTQPEPGRHTPGAGRTVYRVRPEFGADDQYGDELHAMPRPASAEDTAVLPVIGDEFLFCRRPPRLYDATEVAFLAATRRRGTDIADNWGAIHHG